MRTETRKFYEDISESIAFWKITATFSDSKIQPDETLSEHSIPNLEVDNGCKLRVRRLLHCYEERVMRQRGTGDLNKNLNFKLFNTAMIHLAKRKFTGNFIAALFNYNYNLHWLSLTQKLRNFAKKAFFVHFSVLPILNRQRRGLYSERRKISKVLHHAAQARE